MIIALISILIITLIVYFVKSKLQLKVCSICAGVSFTWFWLLFGMYFGFLSVSRYEIITAILMGASIGGIVMELKKMFLKFRSKTENKEIKKQLDNCC